MSEESKKKERRRELQGVVTSDKMDKTRVIQVRWATKHPKYHKVVQKASKYKAHDEENKSKTGDVVRIRETRPLSKDKRWVILEILNQTA